MNKNSQLFALACLLLFAGAVSATCDDTLPATGARDDVLIIVNDNVLDSCEVGRYYAEKRGLGQNNIVHTVTRAGHLLHYDEFRNFSDQLIHYMQKNTLVAGAPPAPVCTDGLSPYYCQASVDHLRQYTKIRYLVPVRGVPMRTRIFTTQSTSVDNYLAFSLLRYIDSDVEFSFKEREIAFGDGRGMRTVNPEQDGELIVGRIDGVNLESTSRLIDRTMEAERNGIYGKLYGSWFGEIGGKAQWLDYSKTAEDGFSPKPVYGNKTEGIAGDSWHYQLGLFGESQPQCLDYISFSKNSAAGKAPLECSVRFSESAPGTSGSRTPSVPDALIYLGSLHGQSSGGGSFNAVLNYERDAGCTPKLCKDAKKPVDCSAISTDILKEINTECVGVADGFFGYNFQSWPVASMALWPTGYMSDDSGSTNLDIVYPWVRNTIGFDDNYSLWFSNTDSVANPLCYSTSDFSAEPDDACRNTHILDMYPATISIAQDFNAANPQTYRVRFYYMSSNIKEAATINVNLRVQSVADDNWADYGILPAAVVKPGDTNWTEVILDIPLDPDKQSDANRTFDRLKFRVFSSLYEGEIGFDNFSIRETTTDTKLTSNADFSQGHEQVSGGDHAAMFMNRLNAVGYWGSVSHYGSDGHSFDDNSQETVLYFLRGLPLGDAVWWGESRMSGIYYGDPLYSPVAVRFDYINNSASSLQDTVAGNFELYGSTVNGRDDTRVTTSYTVEYCTGTDFYDCDLANSWLSTGLSGIGGVENTSLGTWDTTQMATGNYVLRLSVTSNNSLKNRTQTLYDYYPVMVYSAAGDYDGDNLTNLDEITSGTDPADVFSPSGEGMNVYIEETFKQPSSSFENTNIMYLLTWNQALGAGAVTAAYTVSGGGNELTGNLTDLGDGRYGAGIALSALNYTGNDVVVTTHLQRKNTRFNQQKIIAVTSSDNFPPVVSITSPTPQSVIGLDDIITFNATANDAEDGDLTAFILWSSDLDGELGISGELNRSLTTWGEHMIRAAVTDAAGKTSYDEITIYLGETTVALTASLTNAKFNKAIKLKWSGIDPASKTTSIYRAGVRIAKLATNASGNDSYIDESVSTISGSSYSYRVCSAKSECSHNVTITIP